MRLAFGLVPLEMCAELDCGAKAYYQWEGGHRLFDVRVALRLKARFGVPLDWLYAGDPRGLPESVKEMVRAGPEG